MTGIADKIKLYNDAYELAWQRMSANGLHGSDNSARLDAIIRTLIKAGRSNASDIASEAVNHFMIKQKLSGA
ncbi:MAG: hypothetical protein Q7T81_02175 [Pseudolabrys sp.]|nr:hypothetical protein [Pseudolabrys sp.]